MKRIEQLQAKILTGQPLLRQVHIWRFQDYPIIFTNGCFDILHRGHLHLLTAIADMGGRLIVGLNSDRSVKKLKGNNRPVLDEQTRALILASFTSVHAITIFDEDTPENLIKAIKPDILVKGGDYTPGQIAGATFVESYGGKVVIIPYLEGYSTSSIIDRFNTPNKS